jgi:uncharacterized protein YejL (UPF0352 family)
MDDFKKQVDDILTDIDSVLERAERPALNALM